MLNCGHGTYRYPSSGGDPRKPDGFGQGHSWGLGGVENRCPSFNRRRAETWLDGAGTGTDAHECVLSSNIPQKNRLKVPTSPWGNIFIFSAA